MDTKIVLNICANMLLAIFYFSVVLGGISLIHINARVDEIAKDIHLIASQCANK